MAQNPPASIQSAEVVLPCRELNETLAFFTGELEFRVEAIFPADAPTVAIISGHGLRIRLDTDAEGSPGRLRIHGRESGESGDGEGLIEAPNGTLIEVVRAESPMVLPPLIPSLVVTRQDAEGAWGSGRAGMQYRDLIPDRQGGRFIASHIRIPDGGPVPDYPHYHQVRFQMIYCYRGRVKVVYEDQGPPFFLEAGDCVVQPPRIRHRVLECSPGLEVIEIGCPARHETRADHSMEMPTPDFRPEREFDGQRFVRHEVAAAVWRPWRLEGFECRDLGIGDATGGLAGARVARRISDAVAVSTAHDAEFLFGFVLEGSVSLRCDGEEPEPLRTGDAFVVPAKLGFALTGASSDLELLDVTLPADFETIGRGVVTGESRP